MATFGASSVKGGNRQIFQEFGKRSGATIYLGTKVETIRKTDDMSLESAYSSGCPWLVRYRDLSSGIVTTRAYDAIIHASPIHPQLPLNTTGIAFSNSDIPNRIPVQPYVHLHVTILVTNATSPRPEFFGLQGKVPNTILSTFEANKGRTKPTFNSLVYLQSLGKLDDERGVEHIVKSKFGTPVAESY